MANTRVILPNEEVNGLNLIANFTMATLIAIGVIIICWDFYYLYVSKLELEAQNPIIQRTITPASRE